MGRIAWHAPFDYSAAPLKDSGFAKLYVPPLTGAGYTVFVVNHRAAVDWFDRHLESKNPRRAAVPCMPASARGRMRGQV